LSRLVRGLTRLVSDLRDLDARFALAGALAVSARAEPRFTRDVDLAVSVPGDSEAETLVRELWQRGYRQHGDPLEHQASGRLATVRLVVPGEAAEGVVADLLFAQTGIEPEVVADAEILEVAAGLRLLVARPGHLLVQKLLADRPQDRLDVEQLLSRCDEGEVARARRAATLVVERGFDRGIDLSARLEQALAPR